jgi:hypothetical protein
MRSRGSGPTALRRWPCSLICNETTRTIELLEALGAKKRNVYVTLTFAGDLNQGILNRFKREVTDLYKEHVDPKNVFFSHYVLIAELREEAQQHYIERIQGTHLKILRQVLEAVKPFHPVREIVKRTEERLAAVIAGQNTWGHWMMILLATLLGAILVMELVARCGKK